MGGRVPLQEHQAGAHGEGPTNDVRACFLAVHLLDRGLVVDCYLRWRHAAEVAEVKPEDGVREESLPRSFDAAEPSWVVCSSAFKTRRLCPSRHQQCQTTRDASCKICFAQK